MLDIPAESLVFWGAVAAVGLAFTGFAGLFAAALHEGTNAYAAQMGAETSRQFEDVFLFVTPKKIAQLGRLAALAAFFLFFIPLFSFTNLASTAAGGGVAFLHPRYHDPYLFQETFLALGRAVRPVFFGSQDGTGTDLFFLICCTDHTLHLHILARLCLLAHGTTLLQELRDAPDAASMHAALKMAEDDFLNHLHP